MMVQEAFSILSLAKYEELCHVKSFSGFFQLSITSLYMDLQYLRSGFIPQIWAPVNYFFGEISHPGDKRKGVVNGTKVLFFGKKWVHVSTLQG